MSRLRLPSSARRILNPSMAALPDLTGGLNHPCAGPAILDAMMSDSRLMDLSFIQSPIQVSVIPASFFVGGTG